MEFLYALCDWSEWDVLVYFLEPFKNWVKSKIYALLKVSVAEVSIVYAYDISGGR